LAGAEVKIRVKVKPSAKQERVEKLESLFKTEGSVDFIVAVKEPPVEGRANEAVLKALAKYLGVARSSMRIISGHSSRTKSVEILP